MGGGEYLVPPFHFLSEKPGETVVALLTVVSKQETKLNRMLFQLYNATFVVVVVGYFKLIT